MKGSSEGPVMAWPESHISREREREGASSSAAGVDTQRLKRRSSPSIAINTNGTISPPAHKLGGKDGLSYAEILRSRNKFSDALTLYESILEVDPRSVEARVGKGICLQMQGFSRQAFESFSGALTLDPKNACALTHCGILYREEGHLLEAAEVCLN
ncbi:hypothetical protein GOP47_0009573 [Adiantum capillus-veneris]|uniref:Uncharacterized protein n=1 Tax=Adiantum capillus-veneris TaxID=13818 RepID=A0A9D4UXC4_ADICA|nr:hypothetical protein GOP47_0009573 [Adiantum capillus-veneris]